MSRLLDPKSKAIMDRNVVDVEAGGDVELAKEMRRVQAELVHRLDQVEARLEEEGGLEEVVRLLAILDDAVQS